MKITLSYKNNILLMKERESFCKSLIGKRGYEFSKPHKIGTILDIVFISPDFSICWYNFQCNESTYFVSIDDIVIVYNLTQ